MSHLSRDFMFRVNKKMVSLSEWSHLTECQLNNFFFASKGAASSGDMQILFYETIFPVIQDLTYREYTVIFREILDYLNIWLM